MVTVPPSPETHLARPFESTVAMEGFEEDQLAIRVTSVLDPSAKVAVAANWALPQPFPPAVGGVTCSRTGASMARDALERRSPQAAEISTAPDLRQETSPFLLPELATVAVAGFDEVQLAREEKSVDEPSANTPRA